MSRQNQKYRPVQITGHILLAVLLIGFEFTGQFLRRGRLGQCWALMLHVVLIGEKVCCKERQQICVGVRRETYRQHPWSL